MFTIGDDEWPGVAKLMEEAAETIQVCAKLMATEGANEHWDHTDLTERLTEELGDLQAAIDFMLLFSGIESHPVHARAKEKLQQFAVWHTEGQLKAGGA